MNFKECRIKDENLEQLCYFQQLFVLTKEEYMEKNKAFLVQ